MSATERRTAAVVAGLVAGVAIAACAGDPPRVLVFSKTAGYRHGSIEVGVEAIRRLGVERGFEVDATEDAAAIEESNLQRYAAVVFLNTTGDVLDPFQEVEIERFVQAGGGFVGVHSASDTEYEWPWYGQLVGAYFDEHPQIQPATLHVEDSEHTATRHLEATWSRTDEWYDLRFVRDDLRVLLTIDESSYEGATTGTPHPMAWTHEHDGGRAFYTALGHTEESYAEPAFLEHLAGGIEHAIGDGRLDYDRVTRDRPPHETHFRQTVLDSNLTEPMELAVTGAGQVLYIERKGAVKLWDPADRSVTVAARIDVFSPENDAEVCDGCEDGLLGITLDPDFDENRQVYLFYSPAGDEPKQNLSRFVLDGRTLDLASERVVLEVPVQRDVCCHTGGSMTFDADGNLWVSTGDDVSPFESDGFAPIDERPGRSGFDAQGTSADTNDLRGKILRIHPEPDGTYTIPEGNLFPPGQPGTRPEIYVMGGRNPFRISVDSRSGFVYWGDIGPDAGELDPERGPMGHDEINQARAPGFHGWPYFVGDNKPFSDYDFATGVSGPAFDPDAPINDSPNNTGLRELPPARGAFIWYPYARSYEFPRVGFFVGDENADGRTAMAGPVFHRDDYEPGPGTFPEYYDGKLFIYEWMRNWIMAVTMNERGDYVRMERFLPSTELHRPMDVEFGPDGSMYVLEYGYSWFTQNEDARLSRIHFVADRPNR